jgi:hypothetical protein
MWFEQRNNVPLRNEEILTFEIHIYKMFVWLEYIILRLFTLTFIVT